MLVQVILNDKVTAETENCAKKQTNNPPPPKKKTTTTTNKQKKQPQTNPKQTKTTTTNKTKNINNFAVYRTNRMSYFNNSLVIMAKKLQVRQL